jgi:hypothetical protein
LKLRARTGIAFCASFILGKFVISQPGVKPQPAGQSNRQNLRPTQNHT